MPVPTLPPPLDAFVAAVNGGDTDAALALFAPEGEIDDWGRRFTTPKAMRAWSDREFIGAQGYMTVTRVARIGNQITVDAAWKSNHYSGASRFLFTLVDGRIQQMRIVGE
ncbi:nuclear transport factor 2 family protein [Pseudoxanthomonas wuyuanensis]|uniref:SnoaL-like domain-containing protein n=1 Tax=Pseudoxanthomonas wuyuanensis TaxID=1073196 RepID=A0A286CZ06_9GAMM|nr:nuclear transport factor 2 family protein [Pseudoxanthomonas wuyuanensis]KAF1722253.1 nuclear transport factor 2 family protein [Pseudoxanthomonas wuyuanensis]SOD51637.1 SnoaL-like domain-containing protein [Pseudoxanthomonas wuyuanensis]